MIVHIPSALRSYTAQQGEIQVEGATLADALATLDRRFPGIRFRIMTEQDRIRPHIRIFVNDAQVLEVTTPLQRADTVYIVCALSGG